jgi:hypothetical protein
MPFSGLHSCRRCGSETISEHRGESKVDGAQHFDSRCGNGHVAQLHNRVDPPTSGRPSSQQEPTDCPSTCQFHAAS